MKSRKIGSGVGGDFRESDDELELERPALKPRKGRKVEGKARENEEDAEHSVLCHSPESLVSSIILMMIVCSSSAMKARFASVSKSWNLRGRR